MRRAAFATAFVLVLSATQDPRTQNDTTPPLAAPGWLVDIGGWKLHLNCTGTAQPLRPTVILKAGIGDFSVEWSLVQPCVAEFARVRSQPLEDKPLIVLTAGRNELHPDKQALEEERLKNQVAPVRLSSNGKQIVVRDSGHHIHIEQPEVVVQAIRDAVGTSARSGRIVAKR